MSVCVYTAHIKQNWWKKWDSYLDIITARTQLVLDVFSKVVERAVHFIWVTFLWFGHVQPIPISHIKSYVKSFLSRLFLWVWSPDCVSNKLYNRAVLSKAAFLSASSVTLGPQLIFFFLKRLMFSLSSGAIVPANLFPGLLLLISYLEKPLHSDFGQGIISSVQPPLTTTLCHAPSILCPVKLSWQFTHSI